MRTDGTLQSSLRTVTLTVNPASLRVAISEIMYHPQSENDAEEYIELVNLGTSAGQFGGLAIHPRRVIHDSRACRRRVSCRAARLVVAANALTFGLKYLSVSNFVGGWVGQLSNRGEEIELEDAAGQPRGHGRVRGPGRLGGPPTRAAG